VPGLVKSEEADPPPPPAGPPPVGLTAKAPPAVPPDGAAPGSAVDKTPEGEGSPEKAVASSSKPTKPKKEKKKKHRSKSPQRSRKSKRRSRSGRSRQESPPRRLASPVRPTGSRADESSDDREELKRRKYVPRSPSRPPPHHRDHRPAPSGRPLGRRWEGPIPARRREPPPGQGKHYQKNKGVTKRKRRADYNRRRFWRGARR
jgi:hypothetical protein